ncbi:MAG: VOC family protein [Nocardioidaceae bacterium]
MSRHIFVNLPVKDLQQSIDFFTKLGFEFNAQFTDENASCMVISENSYVMLLVEDFFKTFTKKHLCDATTHTEAIVALSADSRQAVDDLVGQALDAGGRPSGDKMGQGPMYGWSFQDLDGHLWEIIYMDPAVIEQ